MIKAGGITFGVGVLNINKVCGSGFKAVMLLAQAIQTGDAEVAVGGGIESMSQVPYCLERPGADIVWRIVRLWMAWFTMDCGML